MKPHVSAAAHIREMDAEQVLEHIAHLAEQTLDTTGNAVRQARLCVEQYRQLTGVPLTPETEGLTVAQAAIVAAATHVNTELHKLNIMCDRAFVKLNAAAAGLLMAAQ